MNIIVVTPPETYPVDLADVYLHLRLDPDDDSPPTHPDDAMLLRNIATATSEAEQMTKRAFVEQTLRIVLPCFPHRCPAYVELLRPPLIGVQSVRYYDVNNTLQTVSPSNYFVTDDLVPRLQFVESFATPCTYRRDDAVRVDYVAGYPPVGSPPEDYVANIPSQIKDAILLGAQLLYDQLSPEQRKAIEDARASLLRSYTVHTF